MSQYSSLNHSILPLIYKILLGNEFTYLIKAPSIKSLVLLGNKPYPLIKHHISNIERISECKLTHILTDEETKDQDILKEVGEGVKVIVPGEDGVDVAKDITPFSIGELSVCYFNWKGLKKSRSAICVTHVSEESTKLPAIFPGRIFGVCSINEKEITNKTQYFKSLERIRHFPDESLIFPSEKVSKKDLQFALAIDAENPILENKVKMMEMFSQDDKLIPSTLIQEKNSNPYFRPANYSHLFESNPSRLEIVSKLIKMRHIFENPG